VGPTGEAACATNARVGHPRASGRPCDPEPDHPRRNDRLLLTPDGAGEIDLAQQRGRLARECCDCIVFVMCSFDERIMVRLPGLECVARGRGVSTRDFFVLRDEKEIRAKLAVIEIWIAELGWWADEID
jgi:hypothetical protein